MKTEEERLEEERRSLLKETKALLQDLTEHGDQEPSRPGGLGTMEKLVRILKLLPPTALPGAIEAVQKSLAGTPAGDIFAECLARIKQKKEPRDGQD